MRHVCLAAGCPCKENRLGYVECTAAELSAYCLDPMGTCSSIFPRFATRPLFSYQSAAVRHGFCLAEDVLSTTELWTRCALAVRCEAFGSYSALSELRLISPEDGLFPWLQISRCSYEGTAPEVALHWGLPEVLFVPHRLRTSPL